MLAPTMSKLTIGLFQLMKIHPLWKISFAFSPKIIKLLTYYPLDPISLEPQGLVMIAQPSSDSINKD